ncbi:MAG TPA: Holliday junction branch migration protein RuvA [Chthonomonadaceae bacterium]|jgi:Holliday junction DNA helicase RuvA|nr:Holliday junction branch migration protein RuvA [Chthonomonadaceae bacterium]
MIAQLSGVVARVEANSVILDVGGVGYQVFVPVTVLSALPDNGGKFTLMTHLIVREDEMTLYGFANATELQAFKILLGVSGVGPKVALALLSTLDVGELARALSTNDTRQITKVPGVGPKLAQRLCLELGDKMAAFAFEQRAERAAAGKQTEQENANYEDVIEALVNLGYSRADSRRAADRAIANASDRTDFSALLRQALNLLTGGR